jgi:glycosyltransferase involved in cell wall biosynthesis
MTPLRAAFVMDQTLGHVTHGQNLRQVLAGRADVVPTWLPIPFQVAGAGSVLPLWRSNWSVRAGWRGRLALSRAMRTQPYAAAFFHTQVVSLFSVGLMKRLPSVVSLDATPINYDSVGEHYGHRPAGDGLLDRQKYRLNRQVFHTAAALISWSEWARRSLIDDYGVHGEKVRVLAPGAAPAYFEIGQRRVEAEQAAGEAQGEGQRKVRLLFVGGDFRRKGGPFLLEALRGPLTERCELHVVTRDEVPAQPGVHVHHGLGPNSQALRQLFATADVFVLPSLADCLAVVLMEATAAALPVITTGVGALPEAVWEGESGLVVAPGDAADLARAVTALVDDAGRRRRMGRAGYALAQEKFNAARNNRALLDLLVEVAQTWRGWRKAA